MANFDQKWFLEALVLDLEVNLSLLACNSAYLFKKEKGKKKLSRKRIRENDVYYAHHLLQKYLDKRDGI